MMIGNINTSISSASPLFAARKNNKRNKGIRMTGRHYTGRPDDPLSLNDDALKLDMPIKPVTESAPPIIGSLRPVRLIHPQTGQSTGFSLYSPSRAMQTMHAARRLGNPDAPALLTAAGKAVGDLLAEGAVVILPKNSVPYVGESADIKDFTSFLGGVCTVMERLKAKADRQIRLALEKRCGTTHPSVDEMRRQLPLAQRDARKSLTRMITTVRNMGTESFLALLPKTYVSQALDLVLGSTASIDQMAFRVASRFLHNAKKGYTDRTGLSIEPFAIPLEIIPVSAGNNWWRNGSAKPEWRDDNNDQ